MWYESLLLLALISSNQNSPKTLPLTQSKSWSLLRPMKPLHNLSCYLLLLSLFKPPWPLCPPWKVHSHLRAFYLQSVFPESSSLGFRMTHSKTPALTILSKIANSPTPTVSIPLPYFIFLHTFYSHLTCHIFNLVFICLPYWALSSTRTAIFANFFHFCIPRTYNSVWHRLGSR